ncbi:MerR family transcriptional regulator [Maribacter halichondriae]|uniref:MerR family transcriptional regulator n=1 Tax=Maribacter halichondriae TaxID=2980554 RepID=UPI0023597B49|nr:MerR family transcriptional regulator [Maribacter sp. Hal144]
MNNVKKYFSIKDLENLSGIKAHTIRIWEKRYDLLEPERTSTNIRTYSLASLQKLLNITLLYNNGYKISKIAKIPEKEIPVTVKALAANSTIKSHAINAFKLAMVNFDQTLFFNTYDGLLAEKTFQEIFSEIFVPLLNEIGMLWQTDSVTPANEHFITGLIKQKIHINTEKLQHVEPVKQDRVFVPYLPENEIHEIGLLYVNYEIVRNGYKSIYLGQTVPLENLRDVMKYFDNLVFVSYFTVVPNKERINKYLKDFDKMMKDEGNSSQLWLMGYQTQYLKKETLPSYIRTFTSIQEICKEF